ncbi:MAG: CRISPR-associated endonuclease Cas1 [Candidatus Thermoplasmatota archaeon]|nr:CRISPR-associated endonuclease Cas1 [Candidatus Thermoplasmatota archaeon]MBU4071767.1 CRISPR-associated endonuclease Cas1 [Candidatus Thermoplasmatota archaeon]MBU4591278.1 CRISPR-associated endonuclease Cas1 [Candidatus Thermoplasmatota archaeon]
MKDYYIFQNCKLDADEHVLHIEGDKSRRLPVEEIAGLHLLSGYTITSGVIDLAAKHYIPIHAYNYYGVYHGTFFPPPVEPTGSILISQVKSRLDEGRRLELARCILETSNRSTNALLKPFDLELSKEIEGETVESLMLSEARVRKEYYALLDTILSPFWSIVKRERQPPRRPADAVLGFANGILYAKMAGWIHRAGLDPRISYIHGESRARNPLALDLAEVMKAPLSEAILLEIAASGSERSLITEVGEGVYLNEKGRKTIIQFIEEALKKSVRPAGKEREDTVEIWGNSVPRKLHRCLVEENKIDLPVMPCMLSSSTMRTLMNGRLSVPY